MKVLKPSNKNIQFHGLIPLQKHKGPLLQLTNDEKQKIASLQENITRMEFEMYQLNKIYDKQFIRTETFQYYANKIDRLQIKINELKDTIREIKINRFNQQKTAELKKKNLSEKNSG